MHVITRSLRAQLIEAFTVLILLSSCFLAIITGREASKENRYERGLLLANRAQSLSRALDQSMWFWIKTVDALRRSLELTDGSPDMVPRALGGLQTAMPAFAWIGLVNTEGRIVYHTAGPLAGDNLWACGVYQRARKGMVIAETGKARLLDSFLPKPEHGPAKFVDISMPIESGDLAGWVLIGRLGWSWASELEAFMLSGEGSDTDTQTFVLSEEGTILLGGPPGEKILSPDRLNSIETSQSVWAVETWPDGNAYLTSAVACSGYKDYTGLQWRVVVRQSLDVAYAPVRRLVTRILVAGLVLALLFAAVASYIAQRTIAPLKKLTEAADRLSRGEPASFPQHQSIPEIEVLSVTLASLVTNLTRSEKARKRIQKTAERDELTGLLNRHGLARRVAEALPLMEQEHRQIEVLYMDLDGFKPINDTYGHPVGDAVLSILAQRLAGCLRRDDVLVRLGGDEFLALLDNTPGQSDGQIDSKTAIARIHAAVSAPIMIDGHTLVVDISIGHATWQSGNEKLEDALKRADKALYRHKKTGRHQREDAGAPTADMPT